MAEGLAAVLALIGLLPSVHPLMDDKGRAPDEGFATLLTLVRFQASMDSLVFTQA